MAELIVNAVSPENWAQRKTYRQAEEINRLTASNASLVEKVRVLEHDLKRVRELGRLAAEKGIKVVLESAQVQKENDDLRNVLNFYVDLMIQAVGTKDLANLQKFLRASVNVGNLELLKSL